MATSLHQKETSEVVWSSDQDVSWAPPQLSVSGTSYWEKAAKQTQYLLERGCLNQFRNSYMGLPEEPGELVGVRRSGHLHCWCSVYVSTEEQLIFIGISLMPFVSAYAVEMLVEVKGDALRNQHICNGGFSDLASEINFDWRQMFNEGGVRGLSH